MVSSTDSTIQFIESCSENSLSETANPKIAMDFFVAHDSLLLMQSGNLACLPVERTGESENIPCLPFKVLRFWSFLPLPEKAVSEASKLPGTPNNQ